MMLSVLPAEVTAAAARALLLASELADRAASLGAAPLLLAAAGDNRLAGELGEAVHDLRVEVTAVLRLARALGATPAQLTAVDGRLAHMTALAHRSHGQALVGLLPKTAALAGTLALEGAAHAVPHHSLAVITPLVSGIPDGPGWAAPAAPPTRNATSPRSTAQWLSTITDAQAKPGQVEVTQLDNGRWVVSMPGIHAFTEAKDPLDLPGAAHAFGAGHSAYAGAVTMALSLAGIPAGAKILLVGHSEGGIVAADLSADPAIARRWHITHLLTAAAPIDDTDIPERTASLALRNRDDIVPALELRQPDAGRDNPHATIEFDDERGSVGANHDLAGVYVPEAESRGFAVSPAVRAWEQDAAPYLTGGPATTQRFQLLDRAPPGRTSEPVNPRPPHLTHS